jgi:hypothetical protein
MLDVVAHDHKMWDGVTIADWVTSHQVVADRTAKLDCSDVGPIAFDCRPGRFQLSGMGWRGGRGMFPPPFRESHFF